MKVSTNLTLLRVLVCCLFSSAYSIQIKDFTAADVQQLFHTDNLANVPEYSIVHIGSRMRRSSDGSHSRRVYLSAFGSDMVLNLNPNLDLARHVPMFYADPLENKGSVSFTPLPQLEEDIGMPYQDEKTRAAVMISHHPMTGNLLLDGTIGDDLVVKPLPHHLHSRLPPTKTDNDNNGEQEESVNALNELPDDELFLDDGESLADDIIFSEGLPLAEDAESVSGSSILSSIHHGRVNETDSESLPSGLLLLRKRRRRSTADAGYHVVYKRKLPAVESDYELMGHDEELATAGHSSSSQSAKSRRKREAPYVIYPEILVLVDYDGYLLHGQDNNAIKSYYVSFWNGVDLRYKLLKDPKVKVSIAGIIISRSRDAMPYLERNRVGRDAIDSASALTDMGKYLYQERRLPTYDIAVAITKYDLCRRRKSGNCTTGTAGFAYVGGACVVNKRLMKVNSVAIVEDTGGFSGIIVAAHEVGHLLGAVHDGSPPPSYLGGPGARHCRWKDGFIMSDLRHTERGFRWSSCSIEQFHHFLNGDTATCLYNLPHEDESLPRVLPGKLLSLDAQCKKDRGTTACFKDERVCAQLFCFDSSSGFCVSYRPAAEGSECGDGKICLNGKCVYDNENSISDFDIHSDRWNSWNDGDWDADNSGDLPPRRPQTSTPRSKTTTKQRLTHNNRWTDHRNNKNNFQQRLTTKRLTTKRLTTVTPSSTTQKPFHIWSTSKRNKHSTTTSTTTRRSTSFNFISRSTAKPWTSRWSENTLRSNTTPRKSFWVTPSSTEKATRARTQTTIATTTTTRKTTTAHRFNNRREEHFTTHNSVVRKNNDSSGNCTDKLVKKSGKLTCIDFLTKYGNRYCNHRYIQKNCCKSRKEFCSQL